MIFTAQQINEALADAREWTNVDYPSPHTEMIGTLAAMLSSERENAQKWAEACDQIGEDLQEAREALVWCRANLLPDRALVPGQKVADAINKAIREVGY